MLAVGEKLIKFGEPSTLFDEGEPRQKNLVRKAKGGSASGPNGILYTMYKCCECLRRCLWKLLNMAWRKKFLPETWLCVKGCFIHKEEDSKDIKQFWTISLLNVAGKIFFEILSKRLTTLLLANNYTNTVYVRWTPKDAKWNKGDLAVLWLSHTNVYGMIHHKLVETTSKAYHIPNKFQQLLQDYFDHLRRVSSAATLTGGE